MNAIFRAYKHWLMTGGSLDLRGATLRWVFVNRSAYAPSITDDEFLADIPPAARVATSDPIPSPTVTAGVLDGGDPVLRDPGEGQPTADAAILYVDTGNEATSRLLVLVDDAAAGLPYTPDGRDDEVRHSPQGIFAL